MKHGNNAARHTFGVYVISLYGDTKDQTDLLI